MQVVAGMDESGLILLEFEEEALLLLLLLEEEELFLEG